MKIAILGFYNQNNLGDDLFQVVLTDWLSELAELTFLNPCDFGTLPDCDIVLVGGGDLINDYFMGKIKELLSGKKIPVYAIGVGFPYPSLITSQYLNIFDYIQTRTLSSLSSLKTLNIQYSHGPDLVRYLPCIKADNETSCIPCPTPKKIGIFLASNMCPTYGKVFNNLVEILDNIAATSSSFLSLSKTYQLYLYSMNTSGGLEDDTHLTSSLYHVLTTLYRRTNIVLVKDKITPEVFSDCYMTICTRFHGHILSLNAGVPFLSLYSTAKVEDLLTSEQMQEYGIKMQVDEETLIPVDFSITETLAKFQNVVHDYDQIVQRIATSNSQAQTQLKTVKQTVQNLVFYQPRFKTPDVQPVLLKVAKYLHTKPSLLSEYKIQDYSHVAQVITFAISRTEYQPFTWGLENNLRKGQLITEAVDWLVKNTPKQYPYLVQLFHLVKDVSILNILTKIY